MPCIVVFIVVDLFQLVGLRKLSPEKSYAFKGYRFKGGSGLTIAISGRVKEEDVVLQVAIAESLYTTGYRDRVFYSTEKKTIR